MSGWEREGGERRREERGRGEEEGGNSWPLGGETLAVRCVPTPANGWVVVFWTNSDRTEEKETRGPDVLWARIHTQSAAGLSRIYVHVFIADGAPALLPFCEIDGGRRCE